MPDLYLLHFEPRYHHARHYLGYAKGIGRGRSYANEVIRGEAWPPHPLVMSAILNHVEITIANVFPGRSRDDRIRMRRAGSLSRFCSVCRELGEHHP